MRYRSTLRDSTVRRSRCDGHHKNALFCRVLQMTFACMTTETEALFTIGRRARNRPLHCRNCKIVGNLDRADVWNRIFCGAVKQSLSSPLSPLPGAPAGRSSRRSCRTCLQCGRRRFAPSLGLRSYLRSRRCAAGSFFQKAATSPSCSTLRCSHMVAFTGLVSIGLQFVPAGRSVVLGYTTPLWVTIGAGLFLGEPLTPSRIIGLIVGLSGLLLLFDPSTFDWSNHDAIIGNALVLVAALCWTASILHVRAHKWVSTPFELVPWQALLATCVLL